MAVSTVADTNASVALLAPNPARKGASIWNASTVTLYVRQGTGEAAASAGNYSFQLEAGDYWESPHEEYVKGGLTGIWASDESGYANITDW